VPIVPGDEVFGAPGWLVPPGLNCELDPVVVEGTVAGPPGLIDLATPGGLADGAPVAPPIVDCAKAAPDVAISNPAAIHSERVMCRLRS
jgi:hypothetical protein